MDGYLPAITRELVDATPAEVLGVATFYEMFKEHPVGTYLLVFDVARRYWSPGVALAACVMFASPVFAETISFKADLKASEEVPPNDSKATGTVTATDTRAEAATAFPLGAPLRTTYETWEVEAA